MIFWANRYINIIFIHYDLSKLASSTHNANPLCKRARRLCLNLPCTVLAASSMCLVFYVSCRAHHLAHISPLSSPLLFSFKTPGGDAAVTEWVSAVSATTDTKLAIKVTVNPPIHLDKLDLLFHVVLEVRKEEKK